MKASIVDLRYHMNDVLKALERNEEVDILYHRKVIGVIHPVTIATQKQVEDHPLFGMAKKEKLTVHELMNKIRGNRYDDI